MTARGGREVSPPSNSTKAAVGCFIVSVGILALVFLAGAAAWVWTQVL